METRSKELLLQNRKVTVQVWDTAGMERFATLTKSFYKSADGVLVAFDVSSQRSFESEPHAETAFWLEQVTEGAREGTKTMLVATKADLQWQVSLTDAESLAARFSMPFVITSALKNSNVQEAFLSFSEMVLQSKRSASACVQLSDPKLSKRKRRC